jgi:DNA-binding NarL/FixJ family response regulator
VIRILVVDDHEFVRQGLERLIATWEGIEVVATAADGAEAVSRYRTRRPDVVLMDIGMAGEDGVDATRRILELDPGARVVVLTSFPDQEHVERALSAGAVGYILKYAAAEDIERAVRAAARGESPLDPKVAHLLLRGRSEEGSAKGLSPREREVLRLVGDGMPNKLIARRLGITERTVKGHLTSIYRQIGVTDRLQAALFARNGGLT